MKIDEFIKNYSDDDELKILFAWNGKHADDFFDENLEFRREVLRYFEKYPKEFSVELVGDLYNAETAFAKEAWGVHPIVSLLAQEMLERGRSKYAPLYLKGWRRGMDALIQSRQIELTKECLQELILYAKSRKENDEFPNKEQAQFFLKFLDHKLGSVVN